MAHDKVGRIVRLKACRIIIGGLIATHRGRIFDLYAGRPASAIQIGREDAIAVDAGQMHRLWRHLGLVTN